MKILKELDIGKDFQINLQKYETALFRKLIGVGLMPNRPLKVLFKLANGVMVVGDQTLKIAIDEFIAGKIIVSSV